MVHESFKQTTSLDHSVLALAYHLLLLNFGTISTSILTATNTLFDIISAPSSQNIISTLCNEALNVLHEHNGIWTKASVARLCRFDSIIRETLWVSGFGGSGLARRVKAADAIALENGVWVPKGETVGVAQRAIHFDKCFHERAWEFDAFRFSRSNKLLSERSKLKETAVEMEKDDAIAKKPWRNKDLVMTSPHFLTLGHSVHTWSVFSPNFTLLSILT